MFYYVNTPQTTPDAPLLFANPTVSCSILDNEYTIIFDTFVQFGSKLIEDNVIMKVLHKAQEHGKYACVVAVN